MCIYLAGLQGIFVFVVAPPLPRGFPGEGPDCHFLEGTGDVWPIPARIRGVLYISFLFQP